MQDFANSIGIPKNILFRGMQNKLLNSEVFTEVDDLIEIVTITKIIEAYEKACEK